MPPHVDPPYLRWIGFGIAIGVVLACIILMVIGLIYWCYNRERPPPVIKWEVVHMPEQIEYVQHTVPKNQQEASVRSGYRKETAFART